VVEAAARELEVEVLAVLEVGVLVHIALVHYHHRVPQILAAAVVGVIQQMQTLHICPVVLAAPVLSSSNLMRKVNDE
jgi:branched-subunit amino acid transport protein AzlD